MIGYLICEDGPLAEWVFSFEDNDQWTIGRDGDTCSFTIQDPMVSRKHLTVFLEEDQYFLENNSSTNPALLNDQEIHQKTPVNEGDIVQIGNNTFRFTFSPPNQKSEEESPNLDQESPNKEEIQENPPQEEPLTLGQFPVETHSSKWILKVISGPATGAQFPLFSDQSYTIGSDSANCDIILHDLSISKNHARITIGENQEASIIDLNSKNGLFVQGKKVETDANLEPNQLISIGTTALLFIDIENTRDTIYSPGIAKHIAEESSLYEENEENTPEEEPEKEIKEAHWKDTFIPVKHIAFASIFSLFIFFGIFSMLALFRSTQVKTPIIDKTSEIKKAISSFENITFNYTPNSSTLFLSGHVLTDIRYNELLHELKNIPFITEIDDNVIIDESVYDNMNSLLMKNPAWKSILMTARSPGTYILTGYVESEEEKAKLRDYINQHFNFLNRLENQVVVESTLNTHINSLLLENGFANVVFQQNNGRVVLSGRAHKKDATVFASTTKQIEQIHGVRTVKDFVIFNTKSTTALNISSQYTITGSSKIGDNNEFILIKGKILGVDDKIDGMTITKIMNHEILLEKEGIKYKIDYNN